MKKQKNTEETTSENRKPLAIVEVQEALKDWYDLRFNEITGVVEGHKKGEPDYKVLNENNLFIQLLTNGYRISFGNLCALLNSEFVETYNPFKHYLAGLPAWNPGDRDYIDALAKHVKALDQEQFDHHLKKMFVRMISCAIDDRSFNKHAFILVGPVQHTGKSTYCRYFCPPALHNYYTESLPGDKDGLISLCENIIINLDELSSRTKFELNQLKSLFSKDSVRVRHPFARKAQTDPRRASFVGSTNEDTFLTDTTGSVRWLCFEIESINFAYYDIPIDLVWSQAYSLYKSGFKFQLTREEIKENETRNQQFQQNSVEYEYVQKYLTPGTDFDNDAFRTASEIRDYLYSMSDRRAELRCVEKVGKALVQLGFPKGSKRVQGNAFPVYGYFIKEQNV